MLLLVRDSHCFPLPLPELWPTELDPCSGVPSVLRYLAWLCRSRDRGSPLLLPLPIPGAFCAVESEVLLSVVVGVITRFSRLFYFLVRSSSTSFSRFSVLVSGA